MSLILDFDLCVVKACRELTFTDTTNAYDALLNTTGYDQNDDVVDHPGTTGVTAVSLVVHIPSGDNFTFDLLGEGFPTIDDELAYTITSSDLGYTDFITDGIYTAIYTVVYSEEVGTFTTSKQFFFTCQAECCIEKLYSRVVTLCDSCENDALNQAFKAEKTLKLAKNAFACGNTAEAKLLLAKVQYICSNANCKCL